MTPNNYTLQNNKATYQNNDTTIQYHHHHHYYCCCCCCCHGHNQHSIQIMHGGKESDILSWSPSNQNNDSSSPVNIDLICSCCGCTSSIGIPKEEGEEKQISTGHTTPTDLKNLKDEEPSSETAEKLKKKKLHAIEELLQTERDYVQDLSYLVEVCLEVLSRQKWITEEHKSIIIRNSQDILAFHKQFIPLFDTSSILFDNDWSSIADVFIKQIEHFSLYKHYCGMHAEAWTQASEYRDRPEWQIFLKDCTTLSTYLIPINLNRLLTSGSESSSSNNAVTQQQQQQKKLHFEDYLIKPVQRICRYQLLIKEILKYTPPDSSEYDLWNTVLKEMQDIVTDIDDRKFQRDMKERTDKFVSRLEDDWRINRRHVSQLGNLLVAGAIEVTYSSLGQSVSKPRYLGCFIFQTYIIMVRPKKVTSYEPKHWFPLRMADFEDLADIEGQREHSFVIRCKKHTFAFSASCVQEKQLWVKKLQEAIVAAKIDASDENLTAQDFIVSSLSGITSKRSPQSIRLSKSFTNILDMTLAANNYSSDIDGALKRNTEENRRLLKRSASTSIQFSEIIKMTNTVQKVQPPLPASSLKKRYSAGYSTFATKQQQQQQQLGLKPRNNSEMYIKPDSFGSGIARRRPSSLYLLSTATTNSLTSSNSVIGKMSLQFKSNHQNALRVAVDHKLRDVCTQEYLSSRAWQMRERRDVTSPSFYQPPVSPTIPEYFSTSTMTSSTGENADSVIKKRKSTSFKRSSAPSFSIIIPKRAYDSSNNGSSPISRYQSDYDLSSTSSSSSLVDRSSSPVSNNVPTASRRPSQSSQLLRRMSQNRGCVAESPVSFDNDSRASSFNERKLKRSPSRRQIFVGKVLRKIANLHQKSPSPTSFSSSETSFKLEEVKKATSVDTKRQSSNSQKMWKRQHEDIIQLESNDLPATERTTTTDDDQHVNVTKNTMNSSPTLISPFAYASTPPLAKRKSSEIISKSKEWKNRLSLIRPASFLRVTSNISGSGTSYYSSSSSVV